MFKRKAFSFLSEKDDRVKIVNERINLTEKHFVEICSAFSGVNRKLARCRDNYDELAKSFKAYSEEEVINDSLNDGLKSFANATTILADFIDLEVHRIEMKIVNELAQYENICRSTRENLRSAVVQRDKEVFRQKQLIEIRNKFSSNSGTADSELLKVKLEVNRTNKEIDEIVDNFERKKLQDIKNILSNFILIQIKEHSKAIEVLTAAYYDMSCVDEVKDFQDFKKALRGKERTANSLKKSVRTSQSLESLAASQLSPLRKRRGVMSKSTKDLSRRVISEDELDHDDDDDDEDDDDEEENEKIEKEKLRKLKRKDESDDDDDDEDDETEKTKSMSSKVPSYSAFKQKNKPMLVGIPKKSLSPGSSPTYGRLVTVESINGVKKYKKVIDCTKSKKSNEN